VGLVGDLAQLWLRRVRPQDSRHDFPLAVVERHDVVPFSMTGLLSPVALFLPGTTHDYAIRQAGPSILSNGEGQIARVIEEGADL
jgi:hypothetical protein